MQSNYFWYVLKVVFQFIAWNCGLLFNAFHILNPVNTNSYFRIRSIENLHPKPNQANFRSTIQCWSLFLITTKTTKKFNKKLCASNISEGFKAKASSKFYAHKDAHISCQPTISNHIHPCIVFFCFISPVCGAGHWSVGQLLSTLLSLWGAQGFLYLVPMWNVYYVKKKIFFVKFLLLFIIEVHF